MPAVSLSESVGQPLIRSSPVCFIADRRFAITLLVVGMLFLLFGTRFGIFGGLGIPGMLVNPHSPLSIATTGVAVLGMGFILIGLYQLCLQNNQTREKFNLSSLPSAPSTHNIHHTPFPKEKLLALLSQPSTHNEPQPEKEPSLLIQNNSSAVSTTAAPSSSTNDVSLSVKPELLITITPSLTPFVNPPSSNKPIPGLETAFAS